MIQYNNFLIKREQSRAGSRFAECEKSRLKAKILMTLALLLTAVTGAWAKTDANTVEWTNETWAGWAENVTTHTVGDITITCSGNAKAYEHTMFSGEPLAMVAGTTDAITFTSNGAPFTSIKIKMYGNTDPGLAGWTWDKGHNIEWSGTPSTSVTLSDCNFAADKITFTTEAPIKVIPVAEPAANTKQWTFNQPGGDVVLTPIYAKAAAFATTGSGSEVTTLLPAAAEGVIAGTDAPLIAEGTGIVAFAGTSTEVTQGTVMYAVTPASVTDASELIPSDWKNTVPTAKTVADDGATVKVWYYIQGADTPDGETPTADNTFNDSEVSSLTVTVLSNKFDLTLKAANANTIDATEASKGTVTVGGQPATVTDGKIQGVKMGSEVKMTAAQGYKFRKVEVKKGGAAAAKTITIGDMELTYADGDTWETIVSKNSDKIKTIAGGYIVQVAQPEPNKYRYIKVVLSTNKVNPSDIIDPSKNYEWGTIEVYS